MNTEIRKIVLVPRFTTYAGARTYLTAAMNIRDYAYVDLSAWRGAWVGTDETFALQMQLSMDLDSWTDWGDAFDPDVEVTFRRDLDFEWMRFAITLGGASPAFTCWMTGDFATRTPVGAGGLR